MGVEIERRFLLKEGIPLPDSDSIRHMRQGYLLNSVGLSIRVRVVDEEQAFMTIKHASPEQLEVRDEYEYEIPVEDALELLALSSYHIIRKQRHIINFGGLTWEVDFFEEENEGLMLAEVELPTLNTPVSLPQWIGKEISDDPKYMNNNLAQKPYTTWNTENE